jgi:hypothetical protein
MTKNCGCGTSPASVFIKLSGMISKDGVKLPASFGYLGFLIMAMLSVSVLDVDWYWYTSGRRKM